MSSEQTTIECYDQFTGLTHKITNMKEAFDLGTSLTFNFCNRRHEEECKVLAAKIMNDRRNRIYQLLSAEASRGGKNYRRTQACVREKFNEVLKMLEDWSLPDDFDATPFNPSISVGQVSKEEMEEVREKGEGVGVETVVKVVTVVEED